jgi:hypothetical protein
MHTRTVVTTVTAALILALSACSGDGGGEESAAPPPASRTPEASATKEVPAASEDVGELEKAVRAYTTAYFKPDVDAGYAMLSARCKEAETKDGFAVTLERARAGNVNHERYALKRFSVTGISGDSAVVTYGVSDDPMFDMTEQWVRESDGWRYDNCFGSASG